MSTEIGGYDELSTWPTRAFVVVGTPPSEPPYVAVTSHVTFGTSFGMRP